MTKELLRYYTSGNISITGQELKSISDDRYNEIEREAFEDVKGGKKLKSETFFKSDAEYKSYRLNVADFANKLANGLTPTLGDL